MKCMFTCNISIQICIFERTSDTNVKIEYFEMLSFESYFAWICSLCMDFACFSRLNVIFKKKVAPISIVF